MSTRKRFGEFGASRHLCVLAAAFIALAFSGLPAAANASDPQPRSDDLKIEVDTDARITCKLFANKPNYSGSKITATGGIKSCTPRPPAACSYEADLEFYQQDGPGPGAWVTRASSSRGHSCPPPARSKKAAGSCHPSSKKYSYRTLTIGAITGSGGTDTGAKSGSVLTVKCY
jgi:hypothetical protein